MFKGWHWLSAFCLAISVSRWKSVLDCLTVAWLFTHRISFCKWVGRMKLSTCISYFGNTSCNFRNTFSLNVYLYIKHLYRLFRNEIIYSHVQCYTGFEKAHELICCIVSCFGPDTWNGCEQSYHAYVSFLGKQFLEDEVWLGKRKIKWKK